MWTYGTFTLTLSTGACALTGDVGPDPNDPNGDWLASGGLVCETPQLSYDQVCLPGACCCKGAIRPTQY